MIFKKLDINEKMYYDFMYAHDWTKIGKINIINL